MTQDTNTDRDAINPDVLALAVRTYIRPQIRRDEADVTLEAALLEQGVMAPHEAIESIEIDTYGVIVVVEAYMFEQVTLFIDINGVVNACTAD
jgi:hypothetical protein